MNIEILLESKLFIAIASAFGGIIVTAITQVWLNKRALFTYYVFHNQIGLSLLTMRYMVQLKLHGMIILLKDYTFQQ